MSKTNTNTICQNMRKIRLEKKLTQKQVADTCGMADATYRTYELGKANPKPATVARIAKALDVSIETIYGLDWIKDMPNVSAETSSTLYQIILSGQGGAIPINAPNQNQLLTVYSKLNEKGQREAIKRIEEMTHVPAYQA